ncbi:hypothetical protein ACJ73_03456 [Blastomyces percursus]|uniref:Uncharacterized protein n=1 Tax=Blastomyces percursus TaxID=1658174 RepID=A0A1J9QYA2_9EURO|nr:hypothetical protein ACJ73_03456 [Blastomyces percursus]
MFVNLGLTADAAAAHTHEFSSQESSPPTTSLLSRSAAVIFPLGFMSSTKNRSNSGFPQPVTSQTPTTRSPLTTPRLSIDEDYVPADPTNIDLNSRAREGSTVAAKKQLQARTKSSFSFAHPPPSTRRKRLALRPKLLLQLHRVSHISRPIPTIDVLSSAICSGPRKFPCRYRGKDSSSANDILLVASDAYEQVGAEDDRSVSSDDDPQNDRDVVATVCHHRKDSGKAGAIAEISLQQGSRWEVSRLPSGGYEFTGTTESGEQRCARWVLRAKAGSRRVSGSSNGADTTFDDGKRFTFSIIDPNTRRHPVLAWMSRQGIDILDRYPLFSSQTQTSSTSPKSLHSAAATIPPQANDYSDPPLIETDDHLRTLIVVSGIWVAFREGWPQNPLYADVLPTTPTTTGPRTSISSFSQQKQEQQQRSQLTQISTNDIEKVDTVDDSTRSKSFPFTGGRLRLGGPGLIHRAKTLNEKSKKATPPQRTVSQRKENRPVDDAEDVPRHDTQSPFQTESLTIGEPTQTRRASRPSSGGDRGQYLSTANNLPPPRYSYGEDNQNDALPSAPSVYFGHGKPEQQSKSKRWRRLGNLLGMKGPTAT